MCWRMPRPRLLAIGALVVAMHTGFVWADPAVGLIGSVVIASWAYTLIRDAGSVLLDVSVDKSLARSIRVRLRRVMTASRTCTSGRSVPATVRP